MTLDRIAPTRRPDAPPAGTQRWRELLFLHWTVPLDAVRPLVPSALSLDPWEGRAYIGLVPFAMRDVRTSFMPSFAGMDFLETNVRTYVHKDGVPGVWFFSLEAASWLAVKAARTGWNLPYFHADMKSERSADSIVYESTRKSERAPFVRASWTIGEELGASVPGTLEHFLLERYVLFSETRKGAIRRGQVHHVPYPARRARVERIEQTLLAAAGLPIEPTASPEAVHYSEGVDVEVFGPWDT